VVILARLPKPNRWPGSTWTIPACDLDFAERYGKIGQGFIEAHHLRPKEGIPVKYDVAADFAVLCSNCHTMIHRFSDSSDVTAFRKFIVATC
jgi:5-methylcytosine-specific restriction protein A